MICTSKTGVLVYGELAKDPEFKQFNGSYMMRLNVRYDSVKNEQGKWLGKFIDIQVWRVNAAIWDGMLQKGDHIFAVGKKVEPHEYNGKTYYQMDVDDVTPTGSTQLNWLQQAINAVWSAAPAEQPEPPTEQPQQPSEPPHEETPPPRQVYGQTAPQPAYSAPPEPPQRQYTEEEARIIEEDTDDLPF